MSQTQKTKPSVSPYKYCISTFQETHSFARRVEQSQSIRTKYTDKLPIIIEKLKNITTTLESIPKTKFLIPDDLTVGQLICIIRKYLSIQDSHSIYLFANDVLLSTGDALYTVYGKYKDTDGFLYIFYTSENTFGSDNKNE